MEQLAPTPQVAPKQRTLKWVATTKQQLALSYLGDDITTELVYGGAAGGAKSFLGCGWLIMSCYRYPGSRWLLGRAVLKQLKQSTLLTFFDVCRKWGLKKGRDYTYNAQEGHITFTQTGSMIYLVDLAWYPSDPDYDSLGSTEFTGAFIDEASQIREKAKNIVRSRLRYRIDEYGIKPKLLMTCNPTKNFLYSEFYKPYKLGTLQIGKAFIVAKVEDNPFLSKAYVDTLKTLDKVSQERLLKGNWEYDDDPAVLCDFDSITDMFTNIVDGQFPGKDSNGRPLPDTRKKYIVCDAARFGADRTVITIWKGMECIAVYVYKKTSTTTTASLLRQHMQKYGVSASHVLVDEDGIGGGVKDQMYGIKGFIANTAAKKGQNYASLKSQCGYLLAAKVNAKELGVRIENLDLRQSLIEEMEQLKAADIDKDTKLKINSKDSMKQALGRSPDILDCLIMRMFFEFEAMPRLTFA